MPITMTLYRGEKSQWWPSPEYRLMYGMTLREPWRPSTVPDLWNTLKEEVKRKPGLSVDKKAEAYAQELRATGRPYALATAWIEVGAFTSDHNYVITIPNAYLFYWGGTRDNPDIGRPVENPTNIEHDFIVLNSGTIYASTILAFGHKTETKEITFFHDLPLDLITSCDRIGVETLRTRIKKWDDLTYDQKILYGKLRR